MSQTVLIAGGSGFIGTRLSAMLTEKGYNVQLLSRKPQQKLKSYFWNPETNEMDVSCLKEADILVNLAGSNIAEKRWTNARKKELVDSRIKSTRLLFDVLKTHTHHLLSYIGASAIGFYPEGENLTEDKEAADSFLGNLCKQWERESKRMAELNIRTSVVRIGLVMSPEGGMLKEILRPLRFGIAPVFGKGNQWQSWIHLDDLCRIFIFLMENNHKSGIYNAVAPDAMTAYEMIISIQKSFQKKGIVVHLPQRLLRILLGEMSEMLTANQKVTSERIVKEGFEFHFPDVESWI